MEKHLSRKKTEILHAFKAISDIFIVDDSGKIFALVGEHSIELAGICDEPI